MKNSAQRMWPSAVRLSENIDNIFDEWRKEVLREVPAASGQTDQELFNSLPFFMKRLAEIISTTSDSPRGEHFAAELVDICREHGNRRAANPNYTLDQVLEEFRILRRIAFSVVEEEHPLTVNERTKLLEAFDNGLIGSATEFAQRLGFQKSRFRDIGAAREPSESK